MSALEGHWRPYHAELDGEEAPVEMLEQTELVLTAASYAVSFGGEVSDRGVLLLESEIAHHLSLRGTAGPNAGRTIPCLFKLAADTLTICYGLGGVRPVNFRTAPGAGLYLVSYRRQTARAS